MIELEATVLTPPLVNGPAPKPQITADLPKHRTLTELNLRFTQRRGLRFVPVIFGYNGRRALPVTSREDEAKRRS